MIHASDDTDTRTPSIDVLDKFWRFATSIVAAPGAARAALHKVEEAHASRCTLASVAGPDIQDTGIDPSDATGVSSWQPDLPFFMQHGFGRR
ncbi:MAG: hypothetical protein U1E06_04880 [Tabrizicola sp.]|uniref:hypothetical protein n=1 Tax=Tabrizicola sp. TaxID=2005166 RepID=UPI00273627F9|nr:hypothetical protein [Tabrizicola sp.]MDP3261924.1 hypothetical protein [Tabrizicola sp.]MDP3649978.1 hypothetical protein [Paracoccaceae bacterium]MDZ4066173.1 hypothetical protein [Tabrizicola sp.]